MLTSFPELNTLLRDLNESARAILQDSYVGGYLQGSFALGGGAAQSDADFIIVTTAPPSGQVEIDLRRLHADIPTRSGFWSEISKVPTPTLNHCAGQQGSVDRGRSWTARTAKRPGTITATTSTPGGSCAITDAPGAGFSAQRWLLAASACTFCFHPQFFWGWQQKGAGGSSPWRKSRACEQSLAKGRRRRWPGARGTAFPRAPGPCDDSRVRSG